MTVQESRVQELVDHFLETVFPEYQPHYIALHTGVPERSNEVHGRAGYARVRSDEYFETAKNSMVNHTAIVFPVVRGDWGLITHYGFWDSPDRRKGNLILWGPVKHPRQPRRGDLPPTFAAGDLRIKAELTST